MDEKQQALRSLAGLSVGDAFGEVFFRLPASLIAKRELPPGPWPWTDDTQMALSIVEVLFSHGTIDQNHLARSFADRFYQAPWRGYGGGARRLLARYAKGADWRVEAPRLFDDGSYGNGAAMRAAPIGGYFAGDAARAADEALKSAVVTHAHPEGQAGAMAVAAAAALTAAPEPAKGLPLLKQVINHLPASRTRDGIERAADIAPDCHQQAADALGTGQQVAAFDTVPFCLWVVAHHSTDYETAMWITVAGLGDRDTTCAIVGGIVALATAVPTDWLARREPLPTGFYS
jgi:ADP-ribosylglycohydrolase